MNTPLVSVVIPVYNVEKYLRETLESVVRQDIGIEKVEIILIDDGSSDGSSVICGEYAAKYPKNIRYIKQKNAGVSAARNNGLKHAKAKYVHFLDSDDIISKNTYTIALDFLEKNKNTIDFATLRVEFFDGRLGEHPLNYKFTSNRVIDVDKEPSATILHISSCIIRRKAIRHEFDTSIKISEDMKFLVELLQRQKAYGVLKDATYYYRKRSEGSSAIDGSRMNRDFYLVTPQKVYEYVLSIWRDKNGKPHKYAQYAVMYDLQWRLRQKTQNVLTAEEEETYKQTILSIIKNTDDDVILAQKHMGIAQWHYAFKVKYNNQIPAKLLQTLQGIADETRPPARVDFIEEKGDQLVIEGWFPSGCDLHEFSMTYAGKTYKLQGKEVLHRRNTFLGDIVYSGGVFDVAIPLHSTGEIVFTNKGKRLGITTARQSKIPDKTHGYRTIGDRILVNQDTSIAVISRTAFGQVARELVWLMRILVALKLRHSAHDLYMILRSTAKTTIAPSAFVRPFLIPVKALFCNLSDIANRIVYHAMKLYIKKPIWIVSDRFLAAGDNGEALYRYIVSQNNNDIITYFAITKTSPDYRRLKAELGHVINSSGLRYRLLFLHASKIISSHADDFVINPFDRRVDKYYDLFKFDYVFLQHGIIRNDMSAWLNKFNKNIRLFITSADKEYDSILKYPYYYTKEKVVLSGLPRYDLLESDPKGKLILAPTWRHHLAVPVSSSDGHRQHNPTFKQSDYFEFYNTLINDPRVISTLKKHNMTGELYLHPAFENQSKDFSIDNDRFTVKPFPYDYKTAFREGDLMVTDYSSVVFDFAYLKKPVIYAQFDHDRFYANHIYAKGYMDDEKDGFGPVLKDYESAVKAIITTIEDGCRMPLKYQKRVDSFFHWHDRHNSKRVYDAINSL